MPVTGMTTSNVKRINKHTIYRYIYNEKAVAKQEIAQNLKLSLTTVTQNLKELEEEQLICRNGHYESTGGRKANVLAIAPTAKAR